jgi:hypothetical protein
MTAIWHHGQIRPYRHDAIAKIAISCWLSVALMPAAAFAFDAAEDRAAPLSTSQIVSELMRHNAERSARLKRYVGCRHYSVRYSGFPSDKSAEIWVSVGFEAPAKRQFRVLKENGSHFLVNHVLRELLTQERDAQDEENGSKLLLTPANYDFALVLTDRRSGRLHYVLQVTPRTNYKYLYRGKIWVDAEEFAVTRLSAEPASSPSIWISHTNIEHEYKKIDQFWLPARNTTDSKVRLGGSAKLTIDYLDYQIGASLESSGDHCANIARQAQLSQKP